jgi:uncharacterized protein YrrD
MGKRLDEKGAAMNFRLLADVLQQDGERLGELRHVIYDPSTGEVVSLVVQQGGMNGRAVVLPATHICGTEPDGEVTYADLTPDQFDQLERYAFGVNVAPPPADIDPIDNQSADLDEGIVEIPDVAPVGAAEGITSIAYTPLIDEARNVPAGDVVIDDGTEVQASDRSIGRVKHVLTSGDTFRVSGFVVEKGHIFTHDREVPMSWIASVSGDVIALNVDAATVEGAAGELER